MKNIKEEDIDFIISSLNAYWNQAHDELTNRKHLGDIERKNLEEIKTKSKEIMKKLGVDY